MKSFKIHKNFKKKFNNTKKFRKFNCAPGISNNTHTCYDNNSLNIIKKLWNMKHPDNKINAKNPKVLWRELREKFNNICTNEYCWMNNLFTHYKLDKKLLKQKFAPLHPPSWNIDKNTWLSSNDIIKVMKHYENVHNDFNFIGPSPIDFDKKLDSKMCVYNDICNFNLQSFLKKNIHKIGFIFNTDPHYKSGSHWIAMYLDAKKNILFYFDSNGDIIPQQVKKLSNRIIDQGKELNLNIKYDDNHKFRHQKTNTECGMFCLYFLISLVNNRHNHKFFKTTKISDEHVEKLRKVYFNEPDK